MAIDAKDLKVKLKNNPQARTKFINDVKVALKSQGVDVENSDILKQFGLHPDSSHQNKIQSASSIVITVTA
jgi:hypothetical protein